MTKNIFAFQQNHQQTNIKKRKIFILSIILLLFLIIIARAFYFQILNFSETDKRVDSTVNKEITETPRRGDILDRNGNILAMSVKKYTLFLDGKNIKNIDKTKKIITKKKIKL